MLSLNVVLLKLKSERQHCKLVSERLGTSDLPNVDAEHSHRFIQLQVH